MYPGLKAAAVIFSAPRVGHTCPMGEDASKNETVDQLVERAAAGIEAGYEAWVAFTRAVDRESVRKSAEIWKEHIGAVTLALQREMKDFQGQLEGRVPERVFQELPTGPAAVPRLARLFGDPADNAADLQAVTALQHCVVSVQELLALTQKIPELTATFRSFVAPDSWRKLEMLEPETIGLVHGCWVRLQENLRHYRDLKTASLTGTPVVTSSWKFPEFALATAQRLALRGRDEAVVWAAVAVRGWRVDQPNGERSISGEQEQAVQLVLEAERRWNSPSGLSAHESWLAVQVTAHLFRSRDVRA